MKHNVFILSLLIASVCFLSGCMIRDEVTYYEMDIPMIKDKMISGLVDEGMPNHYVEYLIRKASSK